MPPKPPEDLKNRKKSEDKSAQKEDKPPKPDAPKEEGPKGTSSIGPFKKCLMNRWIQIIATLFLGALLLLAFTFTNKYLDELKRIKEKYRAVTRIRKFMVEYNDSFHDKDELEAMKGVRLLLDEMMSLKARNDQVQKSIDVVIEKLENEWLPFRGHLYYFDDREETLDSAQQRCVKERATVTHIKSNEEEDFLEATINRRAKRDNEGYWISLRKSLVWNWMNGDRLTVRFWMAGFPKLPSASRRVCAFIIKCGTKRKCWQDAYCDQSKKWVCKWKGDSRWL